MPLENLSQYMRLIMEGVVQAEAEMLIRAFRKCFQVHLERLLNQIFRPNRCYVVNHINLSELLWGAWHHRMDFPQRYDSPSLRAVAIFGTGHRLKKKPFLTFPALLSYQRLTSSTTGTMSPLPNGGLNPPLPPSKGNQISAVGQDRSVKQIIYLTASFTWRLSFPLKAQLLHLS